MKILITGATGFIGGSFAARAAAKGHEVVCMVRRTSDTSLLEQLGAKLVYGRVEEASEVESVVAGELPGVVVHCAAVVMEKNEALLMKTNAGGTRNVCRSCLSHGVGRLIHVSSIAVVCGNDMPLSDAMPYSAKNPYGRSKIEAERIALDFRERGLDIAILRPCMVYGEGEPHAMDRILRYASMGILPVLDIPEQDSKLHLVYVGNVVDAIEMALEGGEALTGTFIIADKDPITIRRFVDILYSGLGGRRPPVVPGWLARSVLGAGPVRRRFQRIYRDRVYDISRAREVLGYDPAVSTEDGLSRTVRCWKEKARS